MAAWMMGPCEGSVAGATPLSQVPTPARAGAGLGSRPGASQDGMTDVEQDGSGVAAMGTGEGQLNGTGLIGPGMPPMLGGQPQQRPQQQQQGMTPLRFNPQQINEIIPMLVIGYMQQQQAIDILNAGNLTTILFKRVDVYIKQMLSIGQTYGAAVRRDGPQHSHGSLALHLFGRTLEFLIANPDVQEKDEMKIVLQTAKDNGPQELAKHVSSFRVVKMYDQARMKVQFQLHSDCHDEVEMGLRIIGGDQKYGTAPRSAIQRRLQAIVDTARG